MKKNFVVFPALILGVAGLAQSQAQAPGPVPNKVGIIYAANAIQLTKEGQKAGDALTVKFQPKKDALDKKEASIQAMQDQLKKGAATLSAEALQKLRNDIDSTTKAATREKEDAQSELDDEQGKIMQELGNKMMEVLGKYATDNGFSVILDVSNQQNPVLWAATGVDITQAIVTLYDAKYPVSAGAAAPPAGTAARPPATAPGATPGGGAPRPPAAPVTKKQ